MKRKQQYHQRQKIRDNIISRLFVKSQAMIHRRLRIIIARRFSFKATNQIIY